MPWDCFCPKCSSCVVGGMTDDPVIMEQEIAEYEDSTMTCESCGTKFNFDTSEIYED